MSLDTGLQHNPDGTNIQHPNICVDVEHGRNHMIIGQWGVPLTYTRGPTNNESGP